MLDTLQALVDRLTANPSVLAVVRYGGRTVDDRSPGGDFDLCVFVRERPAEVESLHFHVGHIPVDLNVRTFDDLRRQVPVSFVDASLTSGQVLYDATGQLPDLLKGLEARWQVTPQPLGDHARAFLRFSHQHALDKVRHRLESHPLLCQVLLHANLYWLLQNYFRLRQRSYPGEHEALRWLEAHDTAFYTGIQEFYAAHELADKLALSERLTEHVLEPIGGPWRSGEVLVLGLNEDVRQLQQQGEAVFRALLGDVDPNPFI